MQQVTIAEAAANLPLLLKAAVTGEEVLIAGEGDEIVRLVPVAPPRNKRVFGSARGTFQMADDFDAPLEDFKEYME
jgi:prevent-host-death family protein